MIAPGRCTRSDQFGDDRFALYKLKEVRSEAIERAKILHLSCLEIRRATGMLHNMKDVKPLLDQCRQINRHEHDADAIFRRGLARPLQ